MKRAPAEHDSNTVELEASIQTHRIDKHIAFLNTQCSIVQAFGWTKNTHLRTSSEVRKEPYEPVVESQKHRLVGDIVLSKSATKWESPVLPTEVSKINQPPMRPRFLDVVSLKLFPSIGNERSVQLKDDRAGREN